MRRFISSIEHRLATLYPEEEAQSLAWWIAEEVTGKTRTELLLSDSECKDTKYSSYIENILFRLHQKEPIQYIFGHVSWRGLDLKVTPATLIPRPETAELVDWIIATHPSYERLTVSGERLAVSRNEFRVLDIGTGSGCIALALKKERPEWQVSGMDISYEALEVAHHNSALLQADISLFKADIFSDEIEDKYNIVVSNPPYVRPSDPTDESVKRYEPRSAVFVPEEDPLIYYRAIAEKKLGKELFLEVNEFLAHETRMLLVTNGYRDVEIKKDTYGKDRFIRARITA